MTVNKITNAPTQNEVIEKINEIIDDKQDELVSGTNIKTINNTSILGSGDITISSGTPTDVQINGTSITSNNVANIVTNTAYNASSNKIATMSDIPTVDQTYNASSPNAQSGVAIAGAGFLQVKGAITSSTNLTTLEEGIYTIDGITHTGFPDAYQPFYGVLVQYGGDYKPQLLVAGLPAIGGLYHRRYLTASSSFTSWVRCGNAATGTNAFTMGGTPSDYTGGTNIGISSQAKQNYGTAFGFNTNANGNSSTCIGRNAGTSAASAIQIGAGINSTANTLQVGFIHAGTNYQLLDGTTGKIPSDRINIATSVSSSSTNAETVGAKLFYDTCGDIETLINAL